MLNLSRSNKYNLRIDFDKSYDSYLYDKNRDSKLLDFFGMYSSLPLGYSHPIFELESFKKAISQISSVKVTNNFISSDHAVEFDRNFVDYAPEDFSHFHYCCTGALAIEAALKVAMFYKGGRAASLKPNILSFDKSFHGINGWGCFTTSRTGSNVERLDSFPESFCKRIPHDLDEVESEFLSGFPVTAVLVEPIQCTAGDLYQPPEFFKGLRKLCDDYDVPLIFDEIQVGFGTTGKKWYYQHVGIVPDIVVFGKKTQLSGIMVRDSLSGLFSEPQMLEVTWDATLIDMVRCNYIIKAYKDYNILSNVNLMGECLAEGLMRINGISNLRRCGLLFAFDVGSKRDSFLESTLDKGLLVNSSEKETVRLRPNLNVSLDEINEALSIMEDSIK